MLHAEFENNDHRIASISELLKRNEDAIMRTHSKNQEAVQ